MNVSFKLVDMRLNTLTFESSAPMEVFPSLLGNYKVYFLGAIQNPDVVQAHTPAGLRYEHPIATLVSCGMDHSPTVATMQKLAELFRIAQGSFVAVWCNKAMDRTILVVRNVNGRFSKGQFITDPKSPVMNKVYMVGAVSGVVDYVELNIEPIENGPKLWITESLLHDWSEDWGYNTKLDTRISCAQLHPTFAKKPTTLLEQSRLVLRAIEFADELDDDHLRKIVVWWSPLDFDLLAANTLTRLTYTVSDNRYELVLPRYDKAIGQRVASAY